MNCVTALVFFGISAAAYSAGDLLFHFAFEKQ